MKAAAKTLLAVYLLALLWLVLFKLSFSISAAIHQQARGFHPIPFAGASRSDVREMILNVVVFIPFGVLLSVNLKRATFWRKLASVFVFSLAVETIQFILAIGITDATDVITNTLGGFLGLALYDTAKKRIDDEKLDRFMLILGTILLIGCIAPIGFLFTHHVRFRSER